MVTAFYETRNAYQYIQILNPVSMTEYKEIVNHWKKDFHLYSTPSFSESIDKKLLYLSQPIEIDAIAFANFLIKRCLISSH